MKKILFITIALPLFSYTLFPQGYPHNQTIVAAEYFLNTDPGEGRGIPVSGTYGTGEVQINLDLNVPEGTKIYIRFKSSNGKWSAPACVIYRNPIYYARNSTITNSEYFLNIDPGQGKGIPAPGGTDISFDVVNVKRDDIIYLRVKDSYDRWSFPISTKFTYKSVISAQFYLMFVDKSKSQVYNMTLQPQESNNFFYTAIGDIQPSQLTNLDSIFVRFQSETGLWGYWKGEKFIRRFITLSHDSINFGEVKINNSKDITFVISNPTLSNENIAINSVSISGSSSFSIVSGGGNFTLLPGQSHSITIRFAPKSLGADSASLTIYHNALNYQNPLKIPLYGSGRNPVIVIQYSPNSLSFGSVYVGFSKSDTLIVSSAGEDSLKIISIYTSMPNVFSLNISTPIVIPSGQQVKIPVRFTPVSKGSYKDTLHIINNSSNNPEAKIPLSGTAFLAPIIFSNISKLDFGQVLVDDTLTKSLYLKNLGEIDTITIKGVLIDTGFTYKLSSWFIKPLDSVEVSISFNPHAKTYYSGVFKILSTAFNDTFTIQLNGVGAFLPKIFVQNTSVNFEKTYIGKTSSLKLKVYNHGLDTLRINSISNTQTSIFSSSISSMVLPPSDSSEITITFKPNSSGIVEDELIVINNSYNIPNLRIKLKGRGFAPPYLSSSKSEIIFDYISPNSTDFKSFWLINRGDIDTIKVLKSLINAPFSVSSPLHFPINIKPKDSVNIVVSFNPNKGGIYVDSLILISDAWNDTLKVLLRGSSPPFSAASYQNIQSDKVKFILSVESIQPLSLTQFEYSINGGITWSTSTNISGAFDNVISWRDTLIWYSKLDLPNFESDSVIVRFTALSTTNDRYIFILKNVGVDNRPPSFNGIKSHYYIRWNKIVLKWYSASDLLGLPIEYKLLNLNDSTLFLTSSDSILINNLYQSTVYRFSIVAYDKFKNETPPAIYEVKVPAAADYNLDNIIDTYDLAVFSSSWTLNKSLVDLSPYQGKVPFVRIIGNDSTNIFDLDVFIDLWLYSHSRGLPKIASFSKEDKNTNTKKVTLKTNKNSVTIKYTPDKTFQILSLGINIPYDKNYVKFASFTENFLSNKNNSVKLCYNDSISGNLYFDCSVLGDKLTFDKTDTIYITFDLIKPEQASKLSLEIFAYDDNFRRILIDEVEYEVEVIPDKYSLYQNYPNPCNYSTMIRFDLPEETNVEITLHDILGRKVMTLVNSKFQAGSWKISIDLSNLPSGVYFYRIVAGNYSEVKKLILLK